MGTREQGEGEGGGPIRSSCYSKHRNFGFFVIVSTAHRGRSFERRRAVGRLAEECIESALKFEIVAHPCTAIQRGVEMSPTTHPIQPGEDV